MATLDNSKQSERGWQVGKSLRHCNQYMFDNEVACDIKFAVHSVDGGTVCIPAHKYILMCRSPVFEAMLCGPGDYKEKAEDVVITDIEPTVFKEMLRFMYTDEVSINEHNVLYLLGAARKYMLDLLADKCKEYLAGNITNDNVCTILSHSVLQSEDDLIQKCLKYVAPRTSVILKTESFLEMSQPALRRLLEHDDLQVHNETIIFEAIKNWAKHNCDEGDAGNDEKLREALGSSIYQVRFCSMDNREFNSCLGFSTIMSDKEVRLFNMFICLEDEAIRDHAQEELKTLGYNTNARTVSLNYTVSRMEANRNPSAYWDYPNGRTDAITFRTNLYIQLLGVSLYCGRKCGDVHQCTVRILAGGPSYSVIEETTTEITSSGVDLTSQVMLKTPVILDPNIDYSVATMITGPPSFRGINGQKKVVKEKVMFEFSKCPKSTNSTGVENGQIPELIFRPYYV